METIEKRKAYLIEYRSKNKERISEQKRNYFAKNRDRLLASMRIYYKSDIEKSKERLLKQRYGISLTDWNDLFHKQAGCCAICGKHQSELNGGLVTDHCHSSGRVRGLLCNSCNVKLGQSNIGNFSASETLYSKALGYVNIYLN
jgi:hypothetical protein